MKHLPLKLGIFVVLLFAAVIAACLLWTPLRIKYYVSKYRSNDTREIARGIRGLLSIGEKGGSELEPLVRDELKYSPLKRRALVADALIANGPEGVGVLAKSFGGGANEAVFFAKHWSRCSVPVKGYYSYPLHFAAENGWKSAAALLLSKGAEVNAKGNDSMTPLHYAAWNGRKDAAALLIEKGADVNAKANHGWTPLHHAAWGGFKDTAALLISKGADVNAKNIDGWTPLHWAAGCGHKDAVALLIEKGADVNGMENEGNTPLDFTRDDKIKSLLRARGGRTTRELREQENRKTGK